MAKVIVYLNNGLGNQLFQYAAGRAIAYRSGAQLRLDISSFDLDNLRSYRLHHYNISANIADSEEIDKFLWLAKRPIPFARRIMQRWDKTNSPYRRRLITEKYFHYDESIRRVKAPVYLKGYWQSEKYFKEIGNILRRELIPKKAPDLLNRSILEQIDRTCSVSLHIRRGDFVADSNTNKYHGVCPLSYYDAAIQLMAQHFEQPQFYVFSDDMEWARTNLSVTFPVNFIDYNGQDGDYADLYLLSRCKHHIIANSSFSWWGAWLSSNPNKQVVAPQKWFADADLDIRDLVPDSWIRL